MDKTDTELKYWLYLLKVPGLGPRRWQHLLHNLTGPLSQVFHYATATLKQLGLSTAQIQAIHAPDWPTIQDDLQWLQQKNHHILCFTDPQYPPLLRHISTPPPLLFIQGNPDYLHTPQCAVVGSRRPSHSGQELAQSFAGSLSQYGYTITSGLALGIDGAAHRAALSQGNPTIAVIATGMHLCYPKRHSQLAEYIKGNGCIVSEHPWGTPVRRQNFPPRNRIISGLSLATLVVEASQDSGSLITAHFANDQGRDVFALPGSLHNPLSQGCHQLIQEGAILVTCVEDIVQELHALRGIHHAWLAPKPCKTTTARPPASSNTLLDCIDSEPTSLERIITRSKLTARQVCSMLTTLEMGGTIVRCSGGYRRIHHD